MNKVERKYRFTEIMSAIDMLPSIDMNNEYDSEGAEDWVLPNLTAGLSDAKLRDAILCQAFKGDEEFGFKLIANLTNSAMVSIKNKDEEVPPSEDDMTAFAISANVLWGIGQAKALYGMLGMISHTCATYDIALPELATAFIKGNHGAEQFGKLDPFALLDGSLSAKEMRRVLETEVSPDEGDDN